MEVKTSDWLLQTTPIISPMVTPRHIEFILDSLEKTLVDDIVGDVVELGCNIGTTSVFIRKMLDVHKKGKNFHVYDSFEGLPKKREEDDFSIEQYTEGSCRCSKDQFLRVFERFQLEVPTINSGWFSEIDNGKYPDNISFAFFDGDFYQSITDSFHKIYHKLSKGAIVCVHDFGWEKLPGAKKAGEDFLRDKLETICEGVGGVGFFTKLEATE